MEIEPPRRGGAVEYGQCSESTRSMAHSRSIDALDGDTLVHHLANRTWRTQDKRRYAKAAAGQDTVEEIGRRLPLTLAMPSMKASSQGRGWSWRRKACGDRSLGPVTSTSSTLCGERTL